MQQGGIEAERTRHKWSYSLYLQIVLYFVKMECTLTNYFSCPLSKNYLTGLANYNIHTQHLHTPHKKPRIGSYFAPTNTDYTAKQRVYTQLNTAYIRVQLRKKTQWPWVIINAWWRMFRKHIGFQNYEPTTYVSLNPNWSRIKNTEQLAIFMLENAR